MRLGNSNPSRTGDVGPQMSLDALERVLSDVDVALRTPWSPRYGSSCASGRSHRYGVPRPGRPRRRATSCPISLAANIARLSEGYHHRHWSMTTPFTGDNQPVGVNVSFARISRA